MPALNKRSCDLRPLTNTHSTTRSPIGWRDGGGGATNTCRVDGLAADKIGVMAQYPSLKLLISLWSRAVKMLDKQCCV